jgi:hypothetical protein
MGWTGIYTDKPTKQVVTEQLTFDSASGSGKVLDAATKGGAVYVAWERTYTATADKPFRRFVMGIVVLVSRKRGEVCIKEISEDMGPCESNCPKRILDKLSPVESFAQPGTSSHEYATAWRDRCRANLTKTAKAPGHGATIKFREPIKFSNGQSFDTFVIHKFGRKVRFAPPGGVPCYCISGWQKRDFDCLTS